MNKKKDDYESFRSIYFIRQSPYVLILRLIVVEAIFMFVYLVFRLPKFFLVDNMSQSSFIDWSIVTVGLFIFLSILQVIAGVFITLGWSNEYYIIRPTDILHRNGTISLTEETFSLKNVEAFTVEQGLMGKLFNFGSIKFYSPVLKQEYFLNNISNPIALKETIDQTVNSIQNQNFTNKREMILPLRNK